MRSIPPQDTKNALREIRNLNLSDHQKIRVTHFFRTHSEEQKQQLIEMIKDHPNKFDQIINIFGNNGLESTPVSMSNAQDTHISPVPSAPPLPSASSNSIFRSTTPPPAYDQVVRPETPPPAYHEISGEDPYSGPSQNP